MPGLPRRLCLRRGDAPAAEPAATAALPSDAELGKLGRCIRRDPRSTTRTSSTSSDPKDNKAAVPSCGQVPCQNAPAASSATSCCSARASPTRGTPWRNRRASCAPTVISTTPPSCPSATTTVRSTCCVTTRDVWTLDPGFNFGRSGGTNTTGVSLRGAQHPRHRQRRQDRTQERGRPQRVERQLRQHARFRHLDHW